MTTTSVRPDVTDLQFQVWERALHPELIDVHAQTAVRRERYSAQIGISAEGQWVTFRLGALVLTELIATRATPLPQFKRVLSHRLRGQRNEEVTLAGQVQYAVSFQLERLEPEVFLHLHQELLADTCRCRVSHQFRTHNRLSPVPLSLLQVEDTPRSLLLHGFHTYPQNCAIVKVQSLFEV